MDSNLKERLSAMGCEAHSLADLKDGVLLSKLVSRCLKDDCAQLQSRIKTVSLHQTANRIINMNMILKALRESSLCSEEVKKLTAFNLLENDASLLLLLQWLVSIGQHSHEPDTHEQPTEPEADALDNLYFVSAIKANQRQEQSSPYRPIDDHHEQEGLQDVAEQPVRASSSAKILKPKSRISLGDSQNASYGDASPVNEPSPFRGTDRPPIPRFLDPSKLKARERDSSLATQPIRHSSLREQMDESLKFNHSPVPEPHSTRTRPPQHSEKRLPLQELQQQHFFQNSSKHSSKRSNEKLQKLQRELTDIGRRVEKEKKELKQSKCTPFPSYLRPKEKPVEFVEVALAQRKELVEWLISINLLRDVALRNYDNLHLICRNGVIFPEVVNYKKGREAKLMYEDKSPNTTEIRSNYKRLFEYLKEFPQFPRELLFRYEYFVPEVNEGAFWQLLHQLHLFYSLPTKLAASRSQPLPAASSPNRQLKSVASLKLSETALPKDQPKRYNEIRFASEEKESNSRSRLSQRQITRSSVYSEDSSEPKVRQPVQKYKQDSEIEGRATNPSANGRMKSTEPAAEANPNVSMMGTSTSYLQLKANREELMATPNRTDNFRNSSNNSMSRSRVSLRNTPKPHPEWTQLPQVTLEMELVCLSYLKECNVSLAKAQKHLFEDPIRNGTLAMLVVCRKFGCRAQFQPKPRSIEDCRENYRTAVRIIKEQVPGFPKALADSTEDIIRGQKNLFYGIVYTLLQCDYEAADSSRKPAKGDSHISTSFEQGQQSQADIMEWLQTKVPRVKQYHQVEAGVKTGLLLSELVGKVSGRELKAVHEQPQYQFQCEANITKAMQQLNDFTGQTSRYTWKVNKLAAGDTRIVMGLLAEIRAADPSRVERNLPPARVPPVSFNHLLRSQQSATNHNQNYNTLNLNNTFDNPPNTNSVSKPLETTMAGHTYSSNPTASLQKDEPEVEVPWMRKLGFSCSLAINSGVLLCRLVEKLTMRTIEGINYSPHNRGEMLGNVRRVLKELKKSPNGKLFEAVDEQYILNANAEQSQQLYQLVREAYKHSYLFKPQHQRRTVINNFHCL